MSPAPGFGSPVTDRCEQIAGDGTAGATVAALGAGDGQLVHLAG